MRVAAIDVGTNSVHLLVADVGPEGELTIVERAREQVELGAGGLDSQRLTHEAMARGVAAMVSFQEALTGLGVEVVRAAATSAVREAQNGKHFVEAVRAATGIHIHTISGLAEARLIHLGAKQDLDYSRGYPVLVDIGGGSVELILCDSSRVLAAHSLPLGHIRISEGFLRSDPPTADEIQAVRVRTRDALRSVVSDIHPGLNGDFIGTSGAVRTLARMAALARGEPMPQHGHGLVLRRGDLNKLVGRFTELARADLSEIPGMDMRRRGTLPAAATVLHQVMKTLERDEIVTSERSLRDGLLLDWVQGHLPELALANTVSWPRMRSVLRLMDRFEGHQDHVRHVCQLALSLFDGLQEVHSLDYSSRRMLEFGALLHDIGHHVAARDHNKHGQYLILNSPMAGFTAPEVAVLANVVRYHRGARPKQSHRYFSALSKTDQRRVETLAAILRLADALDHSHNQPVTEVAVDVHADEIVIRATTRDAAHIERWSAERRKRQLSNLLGRSVTVLLDMRGDPAAFRPTPPDQVE